MAVTAKRSIEVVYSGDVAGTQHYTAADNQASPGAIELAELQTDNPHTVNVPEGATCCTILKPADNEVQIKLKGLFSDTGVRLHNTDPDSITVDPSTTTFILEAGADVTVRLVWS